MMKPSFLAALLGAVLVAGCATVPAPTGAAATQTSRPNYLVIVADDLGWSDLGSFGGEIDTPNLDRLAMSGVRFTGFHTAATCSPTRAMLMTGVDHHLAGFGTMAEILTDATRSAPGYEGYLNDRVATIAELLGAGGYRTLMAGKWHLGSAPDRVPAARGFERSFALMEGASNHFGADQGPVWQEAGLATHYNEDGVQVSFPNGTYSSDYFTDRLIEFLDEGARTGDQRPFFAYLPFTAPHWPLQAPADVVAKYKGRYDAGYEALRKARLARQKELGLVSPDAEAHDLVFVTPWDELSKEQQAIEARKMEVYAAMVDRLDQNVGRLVATLKQLGRYEDTVIIFLGDNGPEGSVIDSPTTVYRKPPNPGLGVDNRLENIGRPTSYITYGPGWAQANSAPSMLMKGYPTEGGIRVAAFVSGRGVVEPGRIIDANLDVRDIAPTLLDLASLPQPATHDDRSILPMEGHSLSGIFKREVEAVRPADEPIGYELFSLSALRKGDWKIVFLPKPDKHVRTPRLQSIGTGRWKLFNIARDPGETVDLADSEPEKLRELVKDYQAYARAKGVVQMSGTARTEQP